MSNSSEHSEICGQKAARSLEKGRSGDESLKSTASNNMDVEYVESEIEQPCAVELSNIAVSENHGENSPYFAGWKAYNEDPYHETANPSGVIQMGLAENQVSFDLLEKYLEEHREALTWGSKGASGFRENALFQDYHGLESFRSAMASFMQQIRGGKAKFDPARIVLTAGATAANELLTFILENPGDALLVPRVSNCGCGRVAVAVVAVATICGRRCGVK